jgi:hypothetical protein
MDSQQFWIPNTPGDQSQCIQKSIELPDELSWGCPSPVPARAWYTSERASTVLSTLSQTPFRVLFGAAVTLFETLSENTSCRLYSMSKTSTTPRPSLWQNSSSTAVSPSIKQFTEDDKLYILQLAIQNSNVYSHSTLVSFWDKIDKAFKTTTEKKYKTLSWTIDYVVKARYKFFENDYNSGEQQA